MSPLSRALTGANLVFDLAGHAVELRREESYAQTGRVGRTLVKEGALRLTMTALRKGTEAGTHHAVSPMTLQVLEGRLRYRVGEEEITLDAGQLLFFGPGHAQDIRALEDTVLLLMITESDED
jgi:quercetin dioxygenase-like cupin family protein